MAKVRPKKIHDALAQILDAHLDEHFASAPSGVPLRARC